MFLGCRNLFIFPSLFLFRTHRGYSFPLGCFPKLEARRLMKRSLSSSDMDVSVAAVPSVQQDILLRVIREIISEIVTQTTVVDANELLEEFLTSKRAEYETEDSPTEQKEDAVLLANTAVAVGAEFVTMAAVPGNGKMQKNIRMNLEAAATEFTSASSRVAGILSLSLVMASLSMDGQQDGGSRAAASAIMSVTIKNKWNILPESDAIAGSVVLALLNTMNEGQDESRATMDLHIIATLSRSFGVHAHQNDALSKATATVINNILSLNTKDDDDDDDKSLNSDAEDSLSQKASMMGVLALAAQLDPWTNLSPAQLMQEAVPYDLWHGADRVCESVIRWQGGQPQTSATLATTREAIHTIIDLAMEAKRYRHADNFATEFYEYGGDSRYLEARFYHACDTIAKLIQKKVFPVIEKQVERVDAAVAKSGKVSSEDFSNEIRMFALQQLVEVGEIEAGKRFHELWNISHDYDEKAIAAAIQARKAKYIQWDEVLPDHHVPELISTSDQLIISFVRLGFGDDKVTGLYGFDAEWGDDDSGGVALLQIATTKDAILIDVPALSMTVDGTEALKQTVGKLFACPTTIVAGFACRQDMARLRSSPCLCTEHWLGHSEGIVDLQSMAGKAEPKLRRTGLSRACEHFLGKPLDKSEQCSLWTARPLTKEQRVYAALDALVCAVLYERIAASPDSSDGKMFSS